MIDAIQQGAFGYFLHETNAANGLVLYKTCPEWPASIAAVGLGLAAYPVGVERGFVSRTEAAERTLTTLRFFWRSRQGPEADATGHKGFYYHFLEGPIVIMIENYKSGTVWQLARGCQHLVAGLRAAGLTGGWLSNEGVQV